MAAVAHQCKTCPAVLVYDQKTRPRLHCDDCQRQRDAESKYRSLKQRRERFGRYYTPATKEERRA